MKMTTAKAADKHKGPRKIRHMMIRPASNGGFISETRREPGPRPKNAPYMDMDEDTETNVHETPESMHQHVMKIFPAAAKPKAAAAKGKPAAPPPAAEEEEEGE